LPPEVGEISQLLPLGPHGYMLAHRKGLSAWTGKEWTHQPAPAPDALLTFYGIPGAFARSGEQRYWQPQPGQLMVLKADGGTVAMELGDAGLPKEHEKDAKLLRLRGADDQGFLWFDLAMPQLASAPPGGAAPSLAPAPPAAAVSSGATPDAPVTSLAPPANPRAEWETYLMDGVDRLYRWKPGGKLERVDVLGKWKTAGAPPNTFPPAGVDLHPEAGGFLLGTDQKRWWLPLDALTR
ncbi:MAG TPA: hypothetical protein VJ483_08455, partial [Holophagaceae bacterium]|nr:hypothetical protein [Holophagaceae bacterium]